MSRYLSLLRRERDFRRTYLATLVSSGGDWFALVPLLALLAHETAGGLSGGLVLAADTATFALLSPYAGTIADRVDRRRLMIGCELVSAGLVLLLLLVRGAHGPLLAIAAIAGIAAAKSFSQPASSAALPNLVAAEDLATANVLTSASWGTMTAAGAALGGLSAAAFGERACFVIDAASFLVSAALLASVRRPFQQPREARPHVGFRADVGEAVRYARSEPRVLALLTCKPGVGFANGALVLFPLLATQVFSAGTLGVGLLFAARGLGAVLGPLALVPRARPGAVLGMSGLCIGTCGVAYVVAAVSPAFAVLLALVVVAHVGGGANWALSSYGLQSVVPDAVRGRVMSADFMLVTLVLAGVQVGSGLLSEVVPTRELVACFGAASVVYAVVWSLLTRSVRLSRPAGEG